MFLWDDEVRLPVIVTATDAAIRRFVDERDSGLGAGPTPPAPGGGVEAVAHAVLLSSRALCDDADFENDSSTFEDVRDTFERDIERLVDVLAHRWGRGPEDADFVSSEVERAAPAARTPEGVPRYTGFVVLWRFPTHWFGLGVRDHAPRPPVELVAMAGDLTLLAPA